MDRVYGPGGNQFIRWDGALSDLMLQHEKYQCTLSFWEQFLLWRYTLNSLAITRSLLREPVETLDFAWVYELFVHYNFEENGPKFPLSFKKYALFFQHPDRFWEQSKEKQRNMTRTILDLYAQAMEEIILNAPPVREEVVIYKATRPYPALPTPQQFTSKIQLTSPKTLPVYQKPFNSATYNPRLNFAPFLPDQTSCCFFEIRVPPCTRVLAISPILSAFPFEKEILLPFGSTFELTKIDQTVLTLSRPGSKLGIQRIQDLPYVIGPLGEPDPYYCPELLSRPIAFYHITLQTPRESCDEKDLKLISDRQLQEFL